MSEHVKTEIGCGMLTLRRPEKKNALSGAMYDALSEGLERAKTDAAIKVVLFQGDGDSFTAGNDLTDFGAQSTGKSAGKSPTQRFIQNLAWASKPLIAAVQGNAVGIGTTMLLHCDLVYLAEDARLITPFVNLALVPEACVKLAAAGADRACEGIRDVCAWRTDGCSYSGCMRPGQCRRATRRAPAKGEGCRRNTCKTTCRLAAANQEADARSGKDQWQGR
jgi:enoyl-CoA hydratase/carnithine racemase